CPEATNEWTLALVKASAGEIFNDNDGKGHNDSHVAVCDGTSCDGSSSDDSSRRLEDPKQTCLYLIFVLVDSRN
ncbi:hypothetical protein JG687_00014303, partial [Phytophthora cactorum]